MGTPSGQVKIAPEWEAAQRVSRRINHHFKKQHRKPTLTEAADELFFMRMSFPTWTEENATLRLERAKKERDTAFLRRYQRELQKQKRSMKRRKESRYPLREFTAVESALLRHWAEPVGDIPALSTVSDARALSVLNKLLPHEITPDVGTLKKIRQRLGLKK